MRCPAYIGNRLAGSWLHATGGESRVQSAPQQSPQESATRWWIIGGPPRRAGRSGYIIYLKRKASYHSDLSGLCLKPYAPVVPSSYSHVTTAQLLQYSTPAPTLSLLAALRPSLGSRSPNVAHTHTILKHKSINDHATTAGSSSTTSSSSALAVSCDTTALNS